MVFDKEGIDLNNWQEVVAQADQTLPVNLGNLKAFVRDNHLINPVLVD